MDHQNMSEHVLCMVLYLVELGLDNHAQDDKEDEVSRVPPPILKLIKALFVATFSQNSEYGSPLPWAAL